MQAWSIIFVTKMKICYCRGCYQHQTKSYFNWGSTKPNSIAQNTFTFQSLSSNHSKSQSCAQCFMKLMHWLYWIHKFCIQTINCMLRNCRNLWSSLPFHSNQRTLHKKVITLAAFYNLLTYSWFNILCTHE